MKKRFSVFIICLALMLSLFPFQAFAATGNYTVTIQAVVVDADGKWVSTNALTSKEFSGTTQAMSGDAYGAWTWTANADNSYTLTAELDSHTLASGYLVYPTKLWDYDAEELEFIGIGDAASDTIVAYGPDQGLVVDNETTFENQFIGMTSSSGGGYYRTYIFQQVSTDPDTTDPDTTDPDTTDPTDPDASTGDTTSPQTGDNSNIALWIALMLTAGAGLTGTILYNGKRKYSR